MLSEGMTSKFHTLRSLVQELISLGVEQGDGLFVHASMSAIGHVIGGPRTVIEALLETVGEDGLVGMPGFSVDAYFPPEIDKSKLTIGEIAQVEDAVVGFDMMKSPTYQMGIIAETFRTWPGTKRSNHPAVSICINSKDADAYLEEHSLEWATGTQSPLGKMKNRPAMKILLIGVGWNRCTALHTAETLATNRRTKTRRSKNGDADGLWVETPDVADDMNRLFPSAGTAFETEGTVSCGALGEAQCKLCDFAALVDFASEWIDRANKKSGDLR